MRPQDTQNVTAQYNHCDCNRPTGTPRALYAHAVDPSERRELEARLARCQRDRELADALDRRLEVALQRRQPLERVMPAVLAILTEHTGAQGAACQTLDESLQQRTFVHGDVTVDAALLEAAEGAQSIHRTPEHVAQIHRLDVAGHELGYVFAFYPPATDEESLCGRGLEVFAEEIDNHLAAIAIARERFEVIRAISDALKEPVLDQGIARSIDILKQHVDFDDLLLLFRHEDDREGAAVRYHVYRDGVARHSSSNVADLEVDNFIRTRARAFLDGNDAEMRARFGITRYREEVLITGVRAARVIGRMLVTSRQGEFHTYDRELLDRFADYLRQRIVDFNREWKRLSMMFSDEHCERLLRQEDYVRRWLTPRERDAAILYADIAGFTRVSERALRDPGAIGRLIDTWSDGAVQIIWGTHGVFDKMVGDCIIGLWGPPFFELSAQECCARAIEAAEKLRAHTRALIGHELLFEIHGLDEPLDLAMGINYCRVSVGLFGPNENYTAFSSGMNNAARLQGVAGAGEVLCMRSVVDAIEDPARFGPPREAPVKNVKDPLCFRALRSED